jgi:hypothetical protein
MLGMKLVDDAVCKFIELHSADEDNGTKHFVVLVFNEADFETKCSAFQQFMVSLLTCRQPWLNV